MTIWNSQPPNKINFLFTDVSRVNITSIFLSLESEREKDLWSTDAKIEQRNQFFFIRKWLFKIFIYLKIYIPMKPVHVSLRRRLYGINSPLLGFSNLCTYILRIRRFSFIKKWEIKRGVWEFSSQINLP